MRTRSILTTAASVLLASTVFAAAQGMGKGGEGGPAPSQAQQPEGKQAPQKGEPQRGERRENGSQKGAQTQEREGSGKQQQGKQETQKEQRGEPKGKDAAQRNERNEGKDAQRGERNEGRDAQRGDRNEGKDAQRGERGGDRKDAERGGQRTGDAGGHKTLTVEQKTKVRETVLRGGSAPRVTNVNFNISVGVVVPTTVRVVELPPVLIEYYPDWRGYFYFVYNDEIIVVDRNHHIVAVLEV
jgi:uncharacterized protein DUF1236